MTGKSATKQTIIEFKQTYGSTSTSNNDYQGPPSPSLTYCVHGKVPKTCCENPEQVVKISQLDTRHCHKPRLDGIDKRARKKLIIACCLCISFMILEIIGGVISNSLAIATDAAHLLTDFASFMISLFAIWVAGRKSTKIMSFGWHRAEVIGALTSVLMIWVVTAILVYLAVLRCINQDFEVNAPIMLITSFIAIIVNLVMGWQLHDTHSHGPSSSDSGGGSIGESSTSHSHSYGHGHDHGQQSNDENINVRAAFIHVLGDVLQSIGVFIAALLIYFIPSWQLADPICTFIFSLVVLATTISILKDTLLVLMEGTPTYLDYTEIKNVFLRIEGVKTVHNLRVWGLSINKVALSAHLAIDMNVNPETVLKEAIKAIHEKYSLFETTIQIERYEDEMEHCNQCLENSDK